MKKILLLLLFFISTSISAAPDLLERLGLNEEFDIPPSVDEAFDFSARSKDANTIEVGWAIAEGNYLYRDKIRFALVDTKGIELLPYELPAGENKKDEIFGLSEVYLHDIEITLDLQHRASTDDVTLAAHYQGCSETFNICYPPTTKTVSLSLPIADLSNTTTTIAIPNASQTVTAKLSRQDQLAQSLAQDSLAKILISFLGIGILLAFTPCVFPMIPILSSIIVGEGQHINTLRAFILSVTYVLAMSITYTLAGVLTGLLGENLQAIFQNSLVIGSFSALFVVLALSLFGLFELQLPHFLQHYFHQISHKQQGGTLLGVAFMGLLSGLIVGPCLAPPLAGALIFIGQHGDPYLGGAALFTLSMGMGLPLIAIGTSGGSLLPRAGGWMNTIKSVFGVLMLGLAIWMLERIVPAWIILLLWGGVLVVVAIYLGALNSLSIDANGWSKFWKGIGLIMLTYGVLLIVGGASGSDHVWKPLQELTSATDATQNQQKLAFKPVNNLTELNTALSNTTAPVMFDFYADWCVDCKKMEVTTFQDPEVISALAGWQLLQVDMTHNNQQHQDLLKQLGVFGPPTILFFDANGQEWRQHRLVGSITAPALQKHLTKLPAS